MNREKLVDDSSNLDNLAYSSKTITSARASVHYPLWLHIAALAVFLVNCAKIPRATDLVRERLPEIISDGTASDLQAANAGAVIVCVLSGLFGAAILYFLHRHFARSNKTVFSVENNPRYVLMWELVTTLSLTLPDLWFVSVGTAPYTSWIFIAAFALVIFLATIILGKIKNALWTLPLALFLGFAI